MLDQVRHLAGASVLLLLLVCGQQEVVGGASQRFKQTVFRPTQLGATGVKRSAADAVAPSIIVPFLATIKVSLNDDDVARLDQAIHDASTTVGINCSLIKTTQTGRARTLILLECTFPPGG